MSEGGGSRGGGDNSYIKNKGERELYYFVLIAPLLLFQPDRPRAQGGFFGPKRAAA